MIKNCIINSLIFFALICGSCKVLAADKDTLYFGLNQVISLAKERSVSAIMAKNRLQRAYWEYRTFKADQLPEVSFSGNIPSYNKSYNSYQNQDGSYSFVRSNNLGINAGFNIDQNIPFTGGKISIGSTLDLSRQLGLDNNEFLSLPIEITLIQPIFGVNSMKWSRKIEPIKYQEAKAKYSEEMEQVSITAISHYFNYLLAQSRVHIATENLKNSQKLYEIALARKKIGEISQSDLMQLELEALQSKATLTEANSNLKAQTFNLNAFLGLDEERPLVLEIPVTIPASGLSYSTVLKFAMENNAFAKNILRRQAEAEFAVATAKGNKRQIDLYASVGYSGVGSNLSGAYSKLVNNQIVQVGVNIPILDWGKREAKVKVAQSDMEVEESMIREEQISFNQNIFLLVENFNNQAKQLEIAVEANQLANNRYNIAFETFIGGKINILDLNNARDSKDAASEKLIEEMFLYWNYYHNIQSVTLVTVDELLPSAKKY